MLVASKCDLAAQRVVTRETALELQQRFGCLAYYEVSAKMGLCVNEIFYTLVLQLMSCDCSDSRESLLRMTKQSKTR